MMYLVFTFMCNGRTTSYWAFINEEIKTKKSSGLIVSRGSDCPKKIEKVFYYFGNYKRNLTFNP